MTPASLGALAPEWRFRAAALLILFVTAGVYRHAVGAGFVGDDFMILHRLRNLTDIGDAMAFFRAEFFEYYRPFGFLSHALVWSWAGADARAFHAVNLVLHVVNTALVLLIGRALAPQTMAGPVAALLFGLHASNHEAVVWISARFDLLATCFSLAALWWMVRKNGASMLIPPVLFFCALLSKESAVALPIAAGAFAVFRLRASTMETALRLVPWLAALGVYGIMRQIGGGIPATGGPGRLPKLALFGTTLLILLILADGRWLRTYRWLRERRGTVVSASAGVLIVAAVAAAASAGRIGNLAGEKLAVAGFALFHLFSPVIDVFERPFYQDPGTMLYWLGGSILLAAAILTIALVWRRLVDDDRMWFLGFLFAATLLPVSALTEGLRYLYLPSAAFALIVGVLLSALAGASRRAAIAVVAIVSALSIVQISAKVGDWNWAGSMTADGARLVDAELAPACGEGHVVFLTSPVAVRSVYSHFYYETFELPRGCMPEVFQVLVRVVRLDTAVDVAWEGPRRIVIRTDRYHGNYLLSEDLRHFTRRLPAGSAAHVRTPLGDVTAAPVGSGMRLVLTLAPEIDADRVRWFYYSNGEIRPAAPPAGTQP